MLILLNVTMITTNFISFYITTGKHLFRTMLIVCVILDLQIPRVNCPEYIFIGSQLFTGIEGFSMLRIQDVPCIIKDHNSVPNQ